MKVLHLNCRGQKTLHGWQAHLPKQSDLARRNQIWHVNLLIKQEFACHIYIQMVLYCKLKCTN